MSRPVIGRPRHVEPSQTYNMIIRERQLMRLRKLAHDRRISVAALLREMIDASLGDGVRMEPKEWR